MSERLKRKLLRTKAKKRQRHALARAVEEAGRHEREKRTARRLTLV
jgi:hypothetical protein